MASRETYRRGPAKPAAVEIRLIPEAGAATDAEYRDALREILTTGEVPEGWDVRGARWGHFRGGTFSRWQAGKVVDLAAFGAVAASTADYDIGIERRGGGEQRRERIVPVTESFPVMRRDTRRHYRGERVSDAYARRYPHLVRMAQVTYAKRVVQVRRGREEAVVRLKYQARGV